MKWSKVISCFALATLLCLPAGQLFAQTGTVFGLVTDESTSDVLVSASVSVLGSQRGAATDGEGSYTILDLNPGQYTLRASFVGYQSGEIEVTIESGTDLEVNFALAPGIDLDPIQVTSGRRQEKLLDAPASIDVVTARDLETHVDPTTVKALRNVTGVNMVQTGIDRYEVVLRAFNNVFSGATHVLTDYRHAGAASIGVNVHSIMANLALDTERIEVVRGPGSALYGAGVDSGVIHYISKDAFQYPGATFAISGGEQSLFDFQGRVATTVGRKLGLKLTGSVASANDFALENCDQALLQMRAFDQCPDPEDAVQILVDGVRDTDFRKFTLNGNVEYRFLQNGRFNLSAGLGGYQGTILSGVGTVQGQGARFRYGQARLQWGGFFAQAYVNSNNTGDSFVYGGDPVVEYSEIYNMQAQYDLGLGSRQQLILGMDLEMLRPDSRGTVLGRNEDRDNIDEYGAYLQSTTNVAQWLDVTLAMRGDYNTVAEKLQWSPRAALVLKPNPGHSLRLTFNRSFSTPSPTTYYLDLVAATLPGTTIKVRGRGAADGFTYEHNPAFLGLGATTDIVASSLLPGMEGAPVPVGLDTGAIYGLLYQGLAAIPDADLAAMLAAAGLNIPAPLIALLKQGLHPDNTQVSGFSPGVLGTLNLSTLDIEINDGNLPDIPPIKQTVSRTFEVGYKGILGEKVLLAIDGYYATRENFVGGLQTRTPFVLVPSLGTDLVRDIKAGLDANATIAGALALFNLTTEQAAQLLVDLAGGGLPSATTPVAIVQPIENNPGIGQTPELMLSYPNFGNISYLGADISLQVLASDNLTVFGNMSWLSDNYFDPTEVGDTGGRDVELSMNSPRVKLKLGGEFRAGGGWSVNLSGRYIEGFKMLAGPYVGDVESHFVLDLGGGYAFRNIGLRADLVVNNLLDSSHREFVGAPKLGRVAIARMTYALDWGR
ncbi:MAG: TonB-dependent receptor [Bacteroidota bacterium]|nr:TonB-dependent receptor [Bacteroidota bacterium]MDE2955738.1 TonB-dependent receptor [Bacteroidota bacterium]